MLHRSLAVAALLALASPAAAQDDMTWSTDRPDGVAPAAIVGDRLLPVGAFEAAYRFKKMDFEGVGIGSFEVDPIEVLGIYATTPFARTDRAHEVTLAYGATPRVSLAATAAWLDRSRSVANEEFFFSTGVTGLSDVTVEGLFGLWDRDAVRVHAHLGAQIPVGSTDERDDLLDLQDQVLPYEMQPGSGSFSFVPGLTAQIQNEYGTVGGQIRARIRLNDNDRDYRLGDEVDGAVWLAYRVNSIFSFNSGVRFRSWGSIEGVDADLDPTRDPGEDAVSSGGEQVDIPLGLNVYMPEGSLAGHRLSMEFLWPVHQDFSDSIRLLGDWGFTLAWRKAF